MVRWPAWLAEEVNEISEIVKHHKIEEVGGSEGTMPEEDFGEVSREL